MSLPQLNVYRHDRRNRTLITLAGEIDLETAPLVSASLRDCLYEGVHTINVDLTTVTFCDVSGLNAFLYASAQATGAGGSLRLHHPPLSLGRILALTGYAFLLNGRPAGADAVTPAPQRPAPLPAGPR
ncbi:STAS domain-containing protein [Streptomyces sp. NPDC023838]|uniref:STAS domain-containing protein n=1 Tax=Streptomyces sp. NPDC023838 TaxID=3154325 RepID=UPI0033D82C21